MTIEIEYLAPDLGQKYIHEMLVCKRPYRDNGPEISLHIADSGQIIVHNYGHGGAGWIMLYGTAKKAVNLLIEALRRQTVPPKKVTILGSGAVGFMCAHLLALYKKDNPQSFETISIITKEKAGLPSYNAGGFWVIPHFSGSTHPSELLDVALETFQWYMQIALGNNPFFPSDAVELQDYIISPNTPHGDVDYLVEHHLIMPSIPIIAQFGSSAKHSMLRYQTIYINTTVFMDSFSRFAKDNDISIIHKDYSSDQLFPNEHPIIFNCTGLNGAQFNPHDSVKVKAVYGHLIKLKNQKKALIDIKVVNQCSNQFQAYIANARTHWVSLLDHLKTIEQAFEFVNMLLQLIDKACQQQDLFANNQERAQFFYLFSKLFSWVDKSTKECLIEFYEQITPRTISRYMMLWQEKFTDIDGHTYDATSYYVTATEQLPEELIRQTPTEDDYIVGKLGGTFIQEEQYNSHEDSTNFSDIVRRANTIFYPNFFEQNLSFF